MSKLLMMIGTAAVAVGAFADGTTLTWNGADGAAWNGANWLNGETPSAWVDGANAVFPAAATVSLDGTVAVSNLTTSGVLTLTGVDAATYAGFVPKNTATLVFPGLKLADITALSARLGGPSASSTNPYPAIGFHYTYSGTTGYAQFQCIKGNNILCVKVTFTEEDDGVHALATDAYYVTNYSSAGVPFGCDIDTANAVTKYIVAAWSDSSLGWGYGVLDLHASTTRVKLSGEATLGGGLTITNAAAEVTAPIAQTWNQTVSCPNGRLVVKGLSAVTAELKYNEAKDSTAWFTTTATDTVFTNMVLSRTVPVSATLRGDIGNTINSYALPYHIKFNGQTMTCQFQFLSGGIKGVLVEFKQEGADVTARKITSYYLSTANGGDSTTLGMDLEVAAAETGTKVVSGRYAYTVESLVLRTADVPSLTLSANNRSCIDMVADNAQIVFSGATSQPVNLTARNGTSIIYNGGTYNSGNGYMRRFESGSTLLAPANLKTEARAAFVFNASTNAIINKNYFNELTLQNGAHIIGGGNLQSGYYNVAPTSTYTSAGTSANYIETPMVLLRHNTTGNMTNTLVLATETDLNISGDIKDDTSLKGARLVKRGAAALTLSGNNTFAGRLTVEAGTLVLGSDTALPSSAPLTLAGGTVLCGTATNATGALTLAGNATINLGDGSISFADSRNETWADGATLNIVGTDKLPTRSLRFGTDGSGLTTAQFKRIRYNGEKVSLNNEGYLSGPKGLIISFH